MTIRCGSTIQAEAAGLDDEAEEAFEDLDVVQGGASVGSLSGQAVPYICTPEELLGESQ